MPTSAVGVGFVASFVFCTIYTIVCVESDITICPKCKTVICTRNGRKPLFLQIICVEIFDTYAYFTDYLSEASNLIPSICKSK